VWEGKEIIPGSLTMWDVAPESMTQAPAVEGPALEVLAVLFRAAMRAEQSHAGGGAAVGL
jgi:hypothetical protein